MIIGEDDTVPGFTFGPADDIVLLCNTKKTQGLQYKVESACNSVVRKAIRTLENVKSADGIWDEEEVPE